MANTPFKLRSGNTTSFKQMGSSPVKQDYHEALEHWKKYKAAKSKQLFPNELHKELNRVAKGGKPKYDQILRDATKNKAELTKRHKPNKSVYKRVKKTLSNTPKQLRKGGKEILKTTSKNIVSAGKQILKKGARFFGTKGNLPIAIASMMIATSSKADQPVKPPVKPMSKTEMEKGKKQISAAMAPKINK